MDAATAVSTDMTIDGVGRSIPSNSTATAEASVRHRRCGSDPREVLLNSVFGCATSSPDATRIDVAELSHAYAVADPRATMVALSLIATDALRNGGVPIAADLLILAHSALSGTLDTATACYLHHRLGMAEAIPFSVSHCHAAGFLYAARIAADLTAVEPRLNSALIVCSDIWVDPLPRRHPPFDSTGDAASAVRLSCRGSGWPLLAIANGNEPTLADPYGAEVADDPLQRWIDAQCLVIDIVLSEARLTAKQIACCIPQSLNRNLTRRVARRLGLPMDRHFLRASELHGLLSTADTPIALAILNETRTDLRSGDPILLWSAGHGGSVAAAIVSVGRSRIPTANGDFPG